MSFFTLTNTWEEWTWGVLDTRNILNVLCSLASQWFVDGLARFVLFCTDSSTCPYLSPIVFLDVDLGPMTLTHVCGGRRDNAFSPHEQSSGVWFSGRQWKLPASAMAAFWPPRWSITWIRIDPLLIYKMVGTGYRKVTTCYLMIPGWQALQSWKLTPTLVVCSLYFDTNLHSQLAFPCISHQFVCNLYRWTMHESLILVVSYLLPAAEETRCCIMMNFDLPHWRAETHRAGDFCSDLKLWWGFVSKRGESSKAVISTVKCRRSCRKKL